MRVLASALVALVLSSTGVAAGYDASWYIVGFWSGEYPAGFSVTRAGTTVMARTGMDKDLPRTVPCVLPNRAVIHPWNQARNRKNRIEFRSATRIIRLVAKKNFMFDGSVDKKDVQIPIRTGDIIEYVYNMGEGLFQVRIGGKEYTAWQGLFEHVEDVPKDQFVEDDWVVMTCENGKRAYIFRDDLRDPENLEKFVPGIADVGPGLQYGRTRDLTAAEARELERQRGQ